jgi:hypothetical protein
MTILHVGTFKLIVYPPWSRHGWRFLLGRNDYSTGVFHFPFLEANYDPENLWHLVAVCLLYMPYGLIIALLIIKLMGW